MADRRLPRGALEAATAGVLSAMSAGGDDLAEAQTQARAALDRALPLIERDALRRAARHMRLLRDLAHGYRCPACHGKPASTPHAGEGRTGYTCGCGHAWEPPKRPGYGMDPEYLLRRLERGEPLPELPAKEVPGCPALWPFR